MVSLHFRLQKKKKKSGDAVVECKCQKRFLLSAQFGAPLLSSWSLCTGVPIIAGGSGQAMRSSRNDFQVGETKPPPLRLTL